MIKLGERKEKNGGHLTVGLEWDVDIMYAPASGGGWNTARVTQQLFERLVEDDLENEEDAYTKIIPALAENYEISQDGLEYTFYLRKNVEFHDGSPFTAETAKINLDRIWNEESPYYYLVATDLNQGLVKVVENTVIIDSHTIKIILIEPFPELLRYLTQEDAPGVE